MDNYQQYIYRHIDGEEVVYIGVGTGARAFYSLQMGHRSKEHSDWMEDKYNQGIIPVEFIATGLTKEEAKETEKELIAKHRPRFNKQHNPDHSFSRWPKEIVSFAKDLRAMGYSYTKISYMLGAESLVSRRNTKQMSIWRMINEL